MPPGSAGHAAGEFAARRFAGLKNTLRPVLTLADTAHRVLGTPTMTAAAKGLHALGLPQWLPSMPRAYRMPETLRTAPAAGPDKVVYFPSCINRTMGPARETPVAEPLAGKMVALLRKAGYEVVFPENMERLCCGTIWESKGMADIADRKTAELEEALWRASGEGRWPVLCDQSPCLHRMREKIGRMKLYEPAEFIWTFLRDRLEFRPQPGTRRRAMSPARCAAWGWRGDRFAGAAVCRRGGGARGGWMLRIRRRPRIHAPRGQRLGPAQTAARHRTLGREGGLFEQPHV